MPDITAARPTSGTPIETAWGDQVHDALEGIQTGKGVLPAAAASTSNLVVVFPRAYAAPPIVAISGSDNAAAAQIQAATLVTATQFTAFQRHRSDANVIAAGFQWIAIGTPA